MEKHKFYSDYERFEYCRKFRLSGKTQVEFARENGLSRETLRDWIRAYNNLSGNFINVGTVSEKEGELAAANGITANVLKPEDIIRKSTHFSRFDHSVVVIEYNGIKITTSLEQAEKILERLNGKVQ